MQLFSIKNNNLEYSMLFYSIMATQISLRLSEDFFQQAKHYAKIHGFLNIQEFIREAAREKIFDNLEIREEYLERLNSNEATSFLSDTESKEFENELNKRAKLQ